MAETGAGSSNQDQMLHHQSWGDGGQAALLLHCSLSSSDAWRGVAGHLADDLTMTAPDIPGHGKSADWDGTSDYHRLCSEAAAEFLTRPMHLIGHSFGATIALRLAVEQPDMVRSLTLIEPVFIAAAQGTVEYARHEAEFQPFLDAIERDDKETAARTFTEIWGTGGAWEELPIAARTYIMARVGLVPAAVPALYEDNAELLLQGRLEAVCCPVLLMEGGQAPTIISAINTALAARLPDNRRVRIKEAGHMVPITHPMQTATAIAGFLSL